MYVGWFHRGLARWLAGDDANITMEPRLMDFRGAHSS